MASVLSDGAKRRLFNMAIKANQRLDECVGESDEDYIAAKTRSDQWNEIVTMLGLTKELRRYYAENKGGKNEQ